MNKNVLSAALPLGGLVGTLALVLALAGCQRAAAPTNLADGAAAAAPSPQERVDPAAIEAELIKLERDWADAFKTGDADAARRVMADDIAIINPDGSTSAKADEVQAIQARLVSMESWEILEPKVTVLDANNAFVMGRGIIKNGKSKVPNSKETIDISGEYRFLDVYAKRNGKWVAVASQTTPIRKAQ
jgi:ketosteroid isomerase-like protein